MTYATAFFVWTFLYKIFYFTLKELIWAFSLNFKNYPVVVDLKMKWNLFVGDSEMEWNLIVGDPEME